MAETQVGYVKETSYCYQSQLQFAWFIREDEYMATYYRDHGARKMTYAEFKLEYHNATCYATQRSKDFDAGSMRNKYKVSRVGKVSRRN